VAYIDHHEAQDDDEQSDQQVSEECGYKEDGVQKHGAVEPEVLAH